MNRCSFFEKDWPGKVIALGAAKVIALSGVVVMQREYLDQFRPIVGRFFRERT